MMTKNEALKLALEAMADALNKPMWNRMQLEDAITAIKEALTPCDMADLCIGCTPRNSDGSCPGQKPNDACDCYEKGFHDGAREFQEIDKAQPPQRPLAGLTDENFEATFLKCGGKWNGDQWVIEDADFHPFLRTIIGAKP